jgi:geranylgeranyl pyrophosphate synthase
LGVKDIRETTKNDIYRIYDYKTANYTFASPLTMGAILAGADKKKVNELFNYGMILGRAFQIKDDIIGIFADSAETGKSSLTDIREAKKTILIWYTYNHCDYKAKRIIDKVFSGKCAGKSELIKIRKLISESGGLEYAKREIPHH